MPTSHSGGPGFIFRHQLGSWLQFPANTDRRSYLAFGTGSLYITHQITSLINLFTVARKATGTSTHISYWLHRWRHSPRKPLFQVVLKDTIVLSCKLNPLIRSNFMESALWCTGSAHRLQCRHPIWVLVQVPAAALLIQHSANGLEKQTPASSRKLLATWRKPLVT